MTLEEAREYWAGKMVAKSQENEFYQFVQDTLNGTLQPQIDELVDLRATKIALDSRVSELESEKANLLNEEITALN
jgi:hypothetical protein